MGFKILTTYDRKLINKVREKGTTVRQHVESNLQEQEGLLHNLCYVISINTEQGKLKISFRGALQSAYSIQHLLSLD